ISSAPRLSRMLDRTPSFRAHRDRPSFPTRRSSDLSRGRKHGVDALELRCEHRVRIAQPDGHARPLRALTGEHEAQRWLRGAGNRSEEHTSELQSRENLVCRLLLEKKNASSGRRSYT